MIEQIEGLNGDIQVAGADRDHLENTQVNVDIGCSSQGVLPEFLRSGHKWVESR